MKELEKVTIVFGKFIIIIVFPVKYRKALLDKKVIRII